MLHMVLGSRSRKPKALEAGDGDGAAAPRRRCLSLRAIWSSTCGARWNSSRAQLAQFKDGAAQLIKEVRFAWGHRRLSRLEWRGLKRREALVLARVWWDLVHVLPLLVNPLPPPLGLVLIAVAYRTPRLMLTPHFHSADQAAAFHALDAKAQRDAAAELLSGLAPEDRAALERACGLMRPGGAAEMQLLRPFDAGGRLALDRLRRRDLVCLAVIARPRLPRALHCGAPACVLRRLVADAADAVQDDDDHLGRSPGALDFTDGEAADAALARGIDADGDALALWLRRHQVLRTAWRRDLPPSFVFFAALILHGTLAPEAAAP
ncbi:hypothetical protein M885DRAFT_508347 [Pelagophyceae sp. CCMP2097]|nr:hypothetical protein M885DRAFT_508347 [Pelagophyceae sp. CCMP2097]